MGMTIDEAISHLDTYSSTMGSGQTTQAQHEESKRVAIEAMHKCQKIKKILDTNVVYSDSDFIKLSAIKRVIDGDKQEDIFWKFIDEP